MTLNNVEIRKRANVYHGGHVTSRTVIMPDGEMKTLGIMLPGTYRFSTEAPERVEVTAGHCRVKREADQEWDEYVSGDSFDIPGHSHFDIEVTDLLDYLCHYGPIESS